MSGESALEIADLLFRGRAIPSQVSSHTVHHGVICHPETGEELDEVLLTVMRSPTTYTGEHIVEISCHGGVAPVKRVLEATLRGGARLAYKGEFTKRAFLNGKLDLAQAEAVLDVVRAKTEKGLSTALCQLQGELSRKVETIRERLIDLSSVLEGSLEIPEEESDYRKDELQPLSREIETQLEELIQTGQAGRMLRDGVSVPIVGRVNVGKSSLLNALLEEERAIVTPYPGTTRDTLTGWIALDGFPVKLVDTAGLRRRLGAVELKGVERTRAAIEEADIVVIVLDRSERLRRGDFQTVEACRGKKGVLVLNKVDLPRGLELSPVETMTAHLPKVEVSATQKLNLGELRATLLEEISRIEGVTGEFTVVTNLRHIEALRHTLGSLRRCSEGIQDGRSPELVAFEVREALAALGEITGETTPEEVLERVFSEFCVGK